MGAASRRKKLDPNYGTISSLPTQSMKYKHSKKIFSELIKQFQVEFIELYNAETVPENYQTVTEEVRLWFNNKLLTYREPDRPYLAKYLFYMLEEVEEYVSLNPLAISCLFKAAKDYFAPCSLQVLLDGLEEALGWKGQSEITAPCEKFAYEEMAQSAKLSLGVD